MESFTPGNFLNWSQDLRHMQTEAVNYITKSVSSKKKSMPKKTTKDKLVSKTCPICGLLNFNAYNLTLHMRRHNNQKPFKCEQCPSAFVIRYELTVHMRSHSTEKLHKCSQCSKCFKTLLGKNIHEDIHGLNEYLCQFCGEKFKSLVQRRKHRASHKNGKFKCNFCYKDFASLEFRKQHETMEHNKPKVKKKVKTANDAVIILKKSPAKQKNRNNYLKCKICSLQLTTKKMYIVHVEKIHPQEVENIFKECKICQKKFIGSAFFTFHMKVHEGNLPHSCSLCDYKTARRLELKTHMRSHSAIKPHICKECGSSFKGKSSLKKHMERHSRNRDKICSKCEKMFCTDSDLVQHRCRVKIITKDTGTEKCNVCNKEISLTYLKNHMKMEHETSDDPIICEHCGKFYQNETKLKRHLVSIKLKENRIMNTFSQLSRLCPYCNEKSKDQLDLMQHCTKYHPNMIYKCVLCKFRNLNYTKYKQHLSKHMQDSSFELFFSHTFDEEQIKEEEQHQLYDECVACGFNSTVKSVMDHHRRTHHKFLPDHFIESVQRFVNGNKLYNDHIAVQISCSEEPLFKITVARQNCYFVPLNFNESFIRFERKNIDLTIIPTENINISNRNIIQNCDISSNKRSTLYQTGHKNSSLKLQKKLNQINGDLQSHRKLTILNNAESLHVTNDVKTQCNSKVTLIPHIIPSSVSEAVDSSEENPVITEEVPYSSSVDKNCSSNRSSNISLHSVGNKQLLKLDSVTNDPMSSETEIPLNLNDIKKSLVTFQGKQFLSVNDLCNLKHFDIKTIIDELRGSR